MKKIIIIISLVLISIALAIFLIKFQGAEPLVWRDGYDPSQFRTFIPIKNIS